MKPMPRCENHKGASCSVVERPRICVETSVAGNIRIFVACQSCGNSVCDVDLSTDAASALANNVVAALYSAERGQVYNVEVSFK